MPTVSIICSTFRPGGIDILLAGLRDQTYRDFELILIDKRYEKRHDRIVELAREYGIKLIHAPEYRKNGKWVSFCSAWNTGMALARGDVLIFFQDFQYAPEGWIEAHLAALDGKRRYVMAPYIYTELPPLKGQDTEAIQTSGEEVCLNGQRLCVEPDTHVESGKFDEMFLFAHGRFQPQWLPGLRRQGPPHQDTRQAIIGIGSGPCHYLNWVHVKNESITRALAYELNGLDERLERGKGPMDTDWENRIRASGAEFWWTQHAATIGPNPRVLFFTQPWGATSSRVEGRWSWEDGLAYTKRRADEMTQRGHWRALNKYDMADFALKLEPWRSGDVTPQSREIDDMSWWGKEIWPDTP